MQYEKAPIAIVATLLGIVMDVKPQWLNDPFPMLITLFEMVTEIIENP